MSDLTVSEKNLYDLWHYDSVPGYEVVYRTDQYTDSYGERVEQEVSMVFKFDGEAYKVNGYADSYGSVEWDGPIRKVKPTTKVIEVWE